MQSETSMLKNRQAALIDMIFSGMEYSSTAQGKHNDQGIKIYQNNLIMTACKALSLNYPVIDKMLGQEAMLLLTRHLLKMELPSSGNWADFGQALPALISNTALHEEHPYLQSTAELEWCLNKAARSAATELDIASLSRLSASDLSTVKIHLAPGLGTVKSRFRIDQLWRLHQTSATREQPNSDAIFDVLSSSHSDHFFIVYQRNHLPCIKPISQPQYLWFVSVSAGFDLAHLFGQYPKFDFSQWLSRAIEEQWIHKLS